MSEQGEDMLIGTLYGVPLVMTSELPNGEIYGIPWKEAEERFYRHFNRRCGTCKWWEKFGRGTMGDCTFPIVLPASLTDNDAEKLSMYPHEGTACPCWEAKESVE